MDDEKLRGIICSLTNLTKVDLNTTLQKLGIDSLKTMELLVALESEFNLIVPDSELTQENFTSGETIIEMIKRIKSTNSNI